MAGDMGWVGKKPLRRLGGMADVLAIATELGYSVPQEDAVQNVPSKSDSLVCILRELMTVQRNLANLQVELQGRQDDLSVGHLTHVSEIEKKCKTLTRTIAILKDVIQNKDRIIARLQQPYSLDCIPVETEYQKQFAELLVKAASDYGALTTSISDLQWTHNFRDPPSIWGDLLRPIPVALASCTRYYEALSAMREAVKCFYKERVKEEAECVTPEPSSSTAVSNSDNVLLRGRSRVKPQSHYKAYDVDIHGDSVDSEDEGEVEGDGDGDGDDQRRISWPPSSA